LELRANAGDDLLNAVAAAGVAMPMACCNEVRKTCKIRLLAARLQTREIKIH
jgi:CDP-4-dehydro-6-deoxyglucose reductase